MNREIKFRAWDGKKIINWEELLKYYSNGESDYDLHAIFSGDEHLELMQNTGLKDKNGKEIYEGDIVKCDPDEPQRFDYNNPYEVKKSSDGVSWNFGSNWFSWIYDIDTKNMACEIIGNIYENPELTPNQSQ
jgi:uncharacterized phage protein (TIGR01671 family)